MFLKKRRVLSLSIDKDKCLGCESCVTICRRKVLDMRDGFYYHAWVKYPQDCTGCGRCVRSCMADVIDLVVVR